MTTSLPDLTTVIGNSMVLMSCPNLSTRKLVSNFALEQLKDQAQLADHLGGIGSGSSRSSSG